jgi:hypothetical protein
MFGLVAAKSCRRIIEQTTFLRILIAMVKVDQFIVFVAAITFAIAILMPTSPAEGEALALLVSGNSRLPWFLAFAALVGMPLAFAIPSLRASSMGRSWKVPSTTYVIPRGVLRLFIGIIAGQAIATLTLALWRDQRFLWLLPLHLLVGGAFCIGAWRRLRKPASTEFTMRWWPPLRR